jgi:hypothetical protein
MGANATTFVPAYVAGEVLTAADLSVTNSGIPVFADSTARDNSFGGTGEKVLAEGQFAYLESTNTTQYYDGSVWQSVGVSPGLVRVGGGALSGSTTTFSSVFSATYDAYRIVFSNLSASAGAALQMTLGATTTNYYYSTVAASTSTGSYAAQSSESNAAKWQVVGNLSSATGGATMDIVNPFLAAKTTYRSDFNNMAGSGVGILAGYLDNTTSYTAFTIAPASGTCTGTVNIYGFALS